MMAAVSRRTKTRALLLAMVAFPVLLQAKVEAVGDVSLVRSLQTVSEVRFLQQNSTDTGFNEAQSWEVLRTTLLLYLPTFVVVILLFCRIRQRHPRVYNVRHTVPRLRSPLAETTHGFVSWMWKVMAIPDDDLFEYCGMDAVCLFRILRLGLRLSGVGVFCSIFLIPVYVTASSEESDHDLWIKTTATNVPSGSQRFTATVLTVYIIMGYTMHLVLSEFQWLTLTRQKYLTNKIVRNYTVYVSGIPEQHRSNVALARFFRRVISEDSVVSASVALNIPKLNAAVNRRENLQRQLERAQVLQQDANINNEPLTTSVTTDAGTTIMEAAPAIAHYQEQLKIVQQEIQNLRLSIAARQEEANVCDKASSSWRPAEHASSSIVSSSLFVGSSNNNLVSSGVNKGNTPLALDNKENATWTSEVKLYSDKKDMLFEGVTLGQHDGLPREGSSSSHLTTRRKTDTCTSGDCEPPNAEEDCLDSLAADEVEAETNRCFPNEIPSLGIIDIVSQGITAVGLGGDDEGKPFDAGFVTFTRLSAVTVALQVVHSTTPFQMQVEDAPSPEEVLWSNVGVAHHALQLGKLLAFSITATLCIFWTVPVTFLVSLTEVNALKTSMPFLQDWLVAAPWLEGLLNQVSPMLLSFLDSVVLPLILREVSKFEGVLGLSHLEASLFFKLAAFRIVQTFIVASLTGSITSALAEIDQPGDVIRYLASTLPPQSVFFIQLILIQTVLGLGPELLRTTALIQALLRKRLGPRITEIDRSSPWLGLRPLCSPRDFLHAQVLAGISLAFMVLFTFVALSPFVSYVLVFYFLSFEIGCRHQFIYVYPSTPDSGGRMWMSFSTIALVCMLVAELILSSYMVIAKATTQFAMMVALVVVTVLFNVYIFQKHYRVALHVSSESSVELDACNNLIGLEGYSFLKDKYLQPALIPVDEEHHSQSTDQEMAKDRVEELDD